MKQRFQKSERLKKRKDISQLFTAKNSFTIHPFKVLWTERNEESHIPLKLAVSIPKKNFKKAVDRNLLKRRTTEAYRTNKESLHLQLQKQERCINVMLVYLAKNKLNYHEIQLKIILILQRLSETDS